MAAATGQNKQSVSTSDADLLLHPELLSQDYMRLILKERNVSTRGREDRDRLTELYLRHVIPLPQRTLPNNRWGRKMEKSRGRHTAAGHRSERNPCSRCVLQKSQKLGNPSWDLSSFSNDQHSKRPLIVFDGKSSQSGPLKVKKPEGTKESAGVTDRLKPPPAANLSNPIRKLSGSSSSSSSSDTPNLKRDANASGTLKSPEVKKKIQHITWP